MGRQRHKVLREWEAGLVPVGERDDREAPDLVAIKTEKPGPCHRARSRFPLAEKLASFYKDYERRLRAASALRLRFTLGFSYRSRRLISERIPAF